MREQSLHEKIEPKSEKQAQTIADSKVSCRLKPQSKVERQKPFTRGHIKKLGEVKVNEVKKDDTDNQSSEIFYRKNDRVKKSLKSSVLYFQKVNSNGFSRCSPPFTQLLPPIIIIAFITEITITTKDYLLTFQKYIIWSIMAFLILPIIYFWYITTAISPTDSIQLQHLAKIQNPSNSSFQPEKHQYFCNLCKTCITHKSFHCNKCHRCVEYFDHHCKWLNNCIGAKNYVQFILLVVLSELFMVFFYVVNAIFMVKITNQEQNLSALFWIAVGTVVFSIVPFVAISMLLCLHMYLIIAKRATIDLIIQNRKKNKIYPQKTSDHLKEKRQAEYQVTSIPEQSPITSPSIFLKQHQILKQLNLKGTSHESLKKFVTNLANNLKISKKEQKDNQNHQKINDQFIDNKVSFKSTIFKKSNSLNHVQSKTDTLIEKNMKKTLIQSQTQTNRRSQNKNDDLINKLDSQEEENDTTKNLITKLGFSIKNQNFIKLNEKKTEKEFSREDIKCKTERAKYKKRKNNPKRLEPDGKNHSQQRIKPTNEIERFDDKQNVDKLKDMAHLDLEKTKLEQNNEIKLQNSDLIEQIKKKHQTTRLFKIFCSNQSQQNQDQEN